MGVKWAYLLIGIIYVLVLVLRVINMVKASKFKAQCTDVVKVFVVKRDFFTTVAVGCTIVTVLINGAAIITGKPLNLMSIIFTVLIMGFTVINSFSYVLVAREENKLLLLGYTLEKNEVEKLKVKGTGNRMVYDMTLGKEIDSYNYIKLVAYGKKAYLLRDVLEKQEEV